MKKIILSLIILFACNSIAEAQTYYYKLKNKIYSKTGVKESYYGGGYITFTNNMNVCYESDKNGNMLSQFDYSRKIIYLQPVSMIPAANLSCDYICKYFSNENDMYVYTLYYSYWSIFPAQKIREGYYYVCFSTDFDKINIDTGDYVIVGERATPPGQASAPTQMY